MTDLFPELQQTAESARTGGANPAPVTSAGVQCLGCEFIAFKPVTVNGRTVCATCPDLVKP